MNKPEFHPLTEVVFGIPNRIETDKAIRNWLTEIKKTMPEEHHEDANKYDLNSYPRGRVHGWNACNNKWLSWLDSLSGEKKLCEMFSCDVCGQEHICGKDRTYEEKRLESNPEPNDDGIYPTIKVDKGKEPSISSDWQPNVRGDSNTAPRLVCTQCGKVTGGSEETKYINGCSCLNNAFEEDTKEKELRDLIGRYFIPNIVNYKALESFIKDLLEWRKK